MCVPFEAAMIGFLVTVKFVLSGLSNVDQIDPLEHSVILLTYVLNTKFGLLLSGRFRQVLL